MFVFRSGTSSVLNLKEIIKALASEGWRKRKKGMTRVEICVTLTKPMTKMRVRFPHFAT